MPRGGGPRPNAGRKPVENPGKSRTVRFTDTEWEQVKVKAKSKNLTASEYIRSKALE